MEERKLKVSLGKSGNGYTNPKIGLPKKWIDDMGITQENRDVVVTYKDGKITIEKCKEEGA